MLFTDGSQEKIVQSRLQIPNWEWLMLTQRYVQGAMSSVQPESQATKHRKVLVLFSRAQWFLS